MIGDPQKSSLEEMIKVTKEVNREFRKKKKVEGLVPPSLPEKKEVVKRYIQPDFTDEERKVAEVIASSTFRGSMLCLYSYIVRSAEGRLKLSFDDARKFALGMLEKDYAYLIQESDEDDYYGPPAFVFTMKTHDLMKKYYAKEEVRK